MTRTGLSLFAALSLLLTNLQPNVFGQTTPSTSPDTQTTRLNEPGPGATQMPLPADPGVEKARRAVNKIGIARKITVFLKNGDALHGAVTKVDKEEFAIAEVDFRQIYTIQYKDVKKIRSGYGGIHLLTGKRASPPKWVTIAAPLGVFFLVLGLPIILLANTKH